MIDHVPERSHALVIVAPLTLSAESENIGGGPEPFCTLPHRPNLGAATSRDADSRRQLRQQGLFFYNEPPTK
jgi:hypothetical protein